MRWLFRPFYKAFFERPLWWFLGKVKAYFLAEVGPRIQSIDERLRALETNNAAQWDALEQLLLALYRQPESRYSEADAETSMRQTTTMAADTDLNRTHAASNLR